MPYWNNVKTVYTVLNKENMSNLALYNKIRTEQRLEPYLINSQNFEHKQALSQLWIYAHDLQTEHGRYLNIAKEDRKCGKCGVIEDELHLLKLHSTYISKYESASNPFHAFSNASLEIYSGMIKYR